MNTRGRRVELKACAKLMTSDFARHPLWRHALDTEADLWGTDEVWLCPQHFARVPRTTDMLITGARLRPAEARWRSGAVTFRFVEGQPIVLGVAVLRPYVWVAAEPDDPFDDSFGLAFRRIAPVEYEALVRIGARTFQLRGAARPRTGPPQPLEDLGGPRWSRRGVRG